MRTKDEIIGHLFNDAKTAKELGSLEHLTDVSLLEVLIDIRDLHAEILYFLKTYILQKPEKD